MEFIIDKASNYKDKPCDKATEIKLGHTTGYKIEINTLEELMNLMTELKEDIVISLSDKDKGFINETKYANYRQITIYDDYLE